MRYARFIASAGCAAVLSQAAFGQVLSLRMNKEGLFRQTSDAPPGAAVGFSTRFRVETTFADDLFSAGVRGLLGGLDVGLSRSGRIWSWTSPSYAGRAEFDQVFPSPQTYFFDLFGPAAIGSPSVGEIAGLLTTRVPALEEGTFGGLQGMNPAAAFNVNINGFTAPVGATSSLVRVEVLDPGLGFLPVVTVTAPPSAFSVTIPAGSLQPARAWRLRVSYISTVAGSASFFGGPAPFEFVGAMSTEADFTTRACLADLGGDGVVDLVDLFDFLNCFSQAAGCADLDGIPGVDLGDFFLFLNAFAEQC